MNIFDSSREINTAEATQKLKEILNLGQPLASGKEKSHQLKASENTMSFINGSAEKTVSDGSKIMDALMANASKLKQNITFQGNGDCTSYDVYGQDVLVTANSPNQITGNSRIRIKNIVDYGWESKYYYGKLVAVHVSGTYIAYGGIVARDKTGIVRVVNRCTGDRILLKGMTGFVKDIAFAHIQNEVLLAIVDEIGNLFIYEIKEDNGKIVHTLALHVKQDGNCKPSDFHRAIWCKYIPDDSVDDDEQQVDTGNEAKLLVVIHDNKAEMLNVDLVIRTSGAGPLMSSELSSGYQMIQEQLQPIIDAAFSPDGAALATASMNGEVKFFQVYMQLGSNESSRCLHQWIPHEGKPVSCIFFLDDHKNRNPEVQFWKFAVTGSDHSKELKVWSCESWTCLQTIRFEVPIGSTVQPCFNAGLDLSSKYLLLSDINRKVLYTLILYQDSEQKTASISSISEFPLPFPMLNYTITDASCKKYKQSVDAEHIDFNAEADENPDDEPNEDTMIEGVVISLFYIQPKSLQECRIVFQPHVSSLLPACSMSTLSQDSLTAAFRDRISDMSFDAALPNDVDLFDTASESMPRTPLSQSVSSTAGQILLTPDAFASPNHSGSSKPLVPTSVFNSTPTSLPLPPVTPSEEMALTAVASDDSLEKVAEHERRRSGRSSGSSPSLEVQQILAPRRSSGSDADEKKTESHSRASDTCSPTFNSETAVETNGMPKDIRQSEELMKLSPIPLPKMNPEYDVTIWPLAPNLNSDMKVISNDSMKERSIEQQSVTEHEHHSFDVGDDESLMKCTTLDSAKLNDLETKLDAALERFVAHQKTMTDTVHVLMSEVRELHDDVRKQPGTATVTAKMGQFFESLQDAMSSMVERKLAQLKQADNKHLESILLSLEDKERQRHDRVVNTLTQALSNTLSNRVDNVIKAEIRSIIPSMLGTIFEPLKQQVHVELSQKFSDNALKDCIGKLLKNKGTVETIGGATASALHGYIQTSYRDTFQTMVIPAFDKACHNVFQQMNESFQQGTKEYGQMLENYLEGKRCYVDQTNDALSRQMQETVVNINTNTERVSNAVVAKLNDEMGLKFDSGLANLQDALTRRIQQSVKEEIGNAMKDQKSAIGDSLMMAIRSGAVTPIPTVDTQTRVTQLIRQGYINAAFQQALSASDLALVTYVCKTLPPSQVFSKTPCQLEQPVLLSLIQQLSADLFTHTELKLSYLLEAVISLDHNNPREHLNIAIGVLQEKLKEFMDKTPNNEHSRRMKTLFMTSKSLLQE